MRAMPALHMQEEGMPRTLRSIPLLLSRQNLHHGYLIGNSQRHYRP